MSDWAHFGNPGPKISEYICFSSGFASDFGSWWQDYKTFFTFLKQNQREGLSQITVFNVPLRTKMARAI
jgi:hypothetical protein